jgi:thiamine biosynthesis lipoprotein
VRLTHPAGGLRAAGARLLALIALATLLLAGCARERLHQQESYVFGTRVELLTWDASDAKAESAMAEVLREFDRLHRAYHAWEPSELTALNDAIAAGSRASRSRPSSPRCSPTPSSSPPPATSCSTRPSAS